jgi:antitoxin component YwqK of YwqJK toxin-antitoxin module
MHKKLFIILCTAMILSCSSDSDTNTDDGQMPVTELKLSKFIFDKGLPTPEYYEYEFEDPKFISRVTTENGLTNGIHAKYFYDNGGNLTEISTYDGDGEFLNNVYEFEYENGDLVLVKIYSSGPIPREVDVSYSGNEVNFIEQNTGRTGKIIFSNGRIISTSHDSGPTSVTKSELYYDNGGLLIEVKNYLNDFPTYTINFEQSETSNPLYEHYKQNEMAFRAIGIFDTDFTGSLNIFTQNILVTKVITGNSNYTDQMEIDFNQDNYPEVLTVFRDGELRSTQTFEYIE